MTRIALALIAGILALAPAAAWQATTPLFAISFQDALPFSATWTAGGGGSSDLSEHDAMGSCGAGITWNRERVAPGVGNGGWNDRGYVRLTYCAFDTSGVTGTWNAGFFWGPPAALDGTWPEVLYARNRLYFEGPITSDSDQGSDVIRTLKFSIWHRDVFDGDQRIIFFLERGDMCGAGASTHVCLSLARNIFSGTSSVPSSGTDVARVAVPIQTWVHPQWSWRHGVAGVSFLKVWTTSANSAAPDAIDTNLTAVPSFPGGTSEWLRDNAGYDIQFDLGAAANNNTHFEDDFVVRMMDFETDDAFDPTWTQAPQTPAGVPYRFRFRDAAALPLFRRPAWIR